MSFRSVTFPPWYFWRAPGKYHDVFGTASAPAFSTGTVVVQFTVSTNDIGLLLGVAFEGGQLTNWYWGTWNLQIGDAMHPYLNGVQGMVSRITEPLEVWHVLKPGQRVRLMVDNANLTQAFGYGGRLFIYTQEKSIPVGPDTPGPFMELRS